MPVKKVTIGEMIREFFAEQHEGTTAEVTDFLAGRARAGGYRVPTRAHVRAYMNRVKLCGLIEPARKTPMKSPDGRGTWMIYTWRLVPGALSSPAWRNPFDWRAKHR